MTRWVNGRPVRRYIKKTDRARGEALDCAVYSLAALMILGPSVFEHLEYWVAEKMKQEKDEPEQQPKEPPKREGWVNRW